jgi:hypothetical protein
MCAQFSFVEKYDKKLYDWLIVAEKAARLRVDDCAKNVRCALEHIVATRINECVPNKSDLRQRYEEKWARKQKKWDALGNRIEALQDAPLLKSIGVTEWPVLPPFTIRVRLDMVGGRKELMGVYDALRIFGNEGAHIEEKKTVRNFHNLSLCLELMHRMLQYLYNEKVPMFDANLMNIESFTIEEKPIVPSDAKRSKCQLEFCGYKREGASATKSYAILRQYARNDVSEKLLKRNIDVQQAATGQRPYGGVKGIIPHVYKLDAGMSDFSIIVYEFPNKPERLEDILPQLQPQERLNLCRDLADCFRELHAGDSPLYHRLLTYESIYICDFGKNGAHRWAPYIKFDFGKITVVDDDLTVMQEAMTAKEKMAEQKIEKYILQSAWNQKQWDIVDLYSLAVLFGDILCGTIARTPANDEDIEDAGYDEEIGEMIEDMKVGSISIADAFEILDLYRRR